MSAENATEYCGRCRACIGCEIGDGSALEVRTHNRMESVATITIKLTNEELHQAVSDWVRNNVTDTSNYALSIDCTSYSGATVRMEPEKEPEANDGP